VAIGCYGVGGAALVAGAVLIYLNRLTPYQDAAPGPADGKKKDAADWAVVPMLGSDAKGVAAAVRF
jgi:hypothetical protein